MAEVGPTDGRDRIPYFDAMPSQNASKPVQIRGGDELRDLVSRESPVLAEFYSRGCPQCRAQEPVLGIVAREFEGVVAAVDPGEDLSLVREYGIASTPGFVLFRDGEPVATLAEGFVPADELLAFARGGRE